MTDARLPERWLNDRRLLRLSDAAYRLHTTGILWCVANRTDGVLADEDLPLLPRVDQAAAAELGAAQLWERVAGAWLIADFAATQTSAHELAVLENARRREREKKQRQRAAAKTKPPAVAGDSPPGRPVGTAQARTGKAGQAATLANSGHASATYCGGCSELLSGDQVAAGWTEHPTCGQPWPQIRQVSA